MRNAARHTQAPGHRRPVDDVPLKSQDNSEKEASEDDPKGDDTPVASPMVIRQNVLDTIEREKAVARVNRPPPVTYSKFFQRKQRPVATKLRSAGCLSHSGQIAHERWRQGCESFATRRLWAHGKERPEIGKGTHVSVLPPHGCGPRPEIGKCDTCVAFAALKCIHGQHLPPAWRRRRSTTGEVHRLPGRRGPQRPKIFQALLPL
jgi:hypothetical protein